MRRERKAGDPEAIVALHARVYSAEYELDTSFETDVAASVAGMVERGWPSEREGIWIVEKSGEIAGCIALTDEGEGEAQLRWFLLDASLRGSGLGRRLMGEVLAKAEAAGYERVGLQTFSELAAAARVYREHGFELIWSRTEPRWGRPQLTYQRYELSLRRAG